MKILLAIHQFDDPSAGGTEVYAAALARHLAGRHEVGLLYPSERPSTIEGERIQGLTHFRFRPGPTADPFTENYEAAGARSFFGRALAAFAPDVVHVQHLSNLGLAFLRAARKEAPRVVMTLADYWPFCPRGQMIRDDGERCEGPDEVRCAACLFVGPTMRAFTGRAQQMGGPLFSEMFPPSDERSVRARLAVAQLATRLGAALPTIGDDRRRVRRRLEQIAAALSLVDLFVAPSKAIAERYVRLGMPAKRVRHLDYGFEPLGPLDRDGRGGGPYRLGFLGSLIPSKGAHVAAEALRLLPRALAELHLWGAFVPYHGDESYKEVVKKTLLGLPHHLHGPLAHEQVPQALASLDALVVPSLWAENSPLVIHEALQAGLPVVASRVGGIPELVREKETGLLFDPGNAKDLAEKIRDLAEGRAPLGDPAGWGAAVTPMSEHARALEGLYREGAGSPAPSPGKGTPRSS